MLSGPCSHSSHGATRRASPLSGRRPSQSCRKALGGGEGRILGPYPRFRARLRGEVTNESCILRDSVSLCYPCLQHSAGSCHAEGPRSPPPSPGPQHMLAFTSQTAKAHSSTSPVSPRTSIIRIPYSQTHSLPARAWTHVTRPYKCRGFTHHCQSRAHAHILARTRLTLTLRCS